MPTGSFRYVQRLNPDWRLGLSAGSYFGLGADYGDDWSGRYCIKEADLITFDTRFGITYRSEVKLEFKDVANLSGLGPVLQGLLNLSGLAGSRVDIDMTVPQAVMVSGYHQLTPEWLWSFGAAYDTSPVDSDKDRTPDLALDRQIRLATGLQYDWNQDVTIGAAYEYIDLGDAGIDRNDGPLKGPLKGDYNPYAIHVFALNLTWRF